MKYLTFCFLSMGLFLSGCENTNSSAPAPDMKKVTGDEVKKEISEAVKTTKEFTSQKRDEYLIDLKKKIDGMDANIAELETKASKLKDDAKKKWDAKLARLKEQRKKVGTKYDEISESSADAWQELKVGLNSAWADMKKAYVKAVEEFEEKPLD